MSHIVTVEVNFPLWESIRNYCIARKFCGVLGGLEECSPKNMIMLLRTITIWPLESNFSDSSHGHLLEPLLFINSLCIWDTITELPLRSCSFEHFVYSAIALFPGSHPASCHLQYGKAGEGLVHFLAGHEAVIHIEMCSHIPLPPWIHPCCKIPKVTIQTLQACLGGH